MTCDPRILIVETAFLGDIVILSSLILSTRESYPAAHLAVLTTPLGRELLDGIPEIDEFIVYDKRLSDAGFRGMLSLVKRLRSSRFDIALSPHRSHRTSAILAASGIATKSGFSEAGLAFLFEFTTRWRQPLHQAEKNYLLLKSVNPDATYLERLKLATDEKSRRSIKATLALKGLPVDNVPSLVSISFSSQWATKVWPYNYWQSLIKLIEEKYPDLKIVLIGSEGDRDTARIVARHTHAIDLTGLTSIGELKALIAGSVFFISGDTGTAHIAAAFGIPQITIFGATTKGLGFTPLGARVTIVENESLDCRPCSLHGPDRCPLGHFKCMLDIKPERVFDQFLHDFGPVYGG